MDKVTRAERKLAGDCIYCGKKDGGLETFDSRLDCIRHSLKEDRTTLWYCVCAPTREEGAECVNKWRKI